MRESRDKPLVWLHGEIKTPPFSARARIGAGLFLRRLQRGEEIVSSSPSDVRRGDLIEGVTMERIRRGILEAAGWRVGTAEEFLDLTEAEAALIEMKLALADGLRDLRLRKSLTQTEAAVLVGSSQSRVAKMEAGDPSVSLDLLVRTLLRLGADTGTVAGLLWAAVKT